MAFRILGVIWLFGVICRYMGFWGYMGYMAFRGYMGFWVIWVIGVLGGFLENFLVFLGLVCFLAFFGRFLVFWY